MSETGMNRREVMATTAAAGAMIVAGAVAQAAGPQLRDREPDDDRSGLDGMWEVAVHGTATYLYIYSFARETFVAAGNIDANWDGQGSSFGPTMGTHASRGRHTYDIREKAWAFDPQGLPAGWSTFEGLYTVDPQNQTLTGDGTWTLHDLTGQAVYVEPLTVTGRRLS